MTVDHVFSPTDKGIPADLIGQPSSSLVGRNIYDGSFPSPLVVAYRTRIQHNLDLMARWARHHGVELAPHAKTTMAPKLIARQVEAGAVAVAVATMTQVRSLVALGVRRVVLANQLVNTAAIEWAGDAIEAGLDLSVFVDSPDGLALLCGDRATIGVLLEVGGAGGRSGTRSRASAIELGETVAKTPGVELRGVAGYEGMFFDQSTPTERTAVRSYLREMVSVYEALDQRNLFAPGLTPVLTAGGSACFDDVAEILTQVTGATKPEVWIRPGCYLTHDHGVYESISPLRANPSWPPLRGALEVIAQVLSRPEPSLALLDAGRRDLSFDSGLPRALTYRSKQAPWTVAPHRWEITSLMDHHTFLSVAATDPLGVGDFVTLGISHPCTTFDKWRHIPEVDDNGTVVDVIATNF